MPGHVTCCEYEVVVMANHVILLMNSMMTYMRNALYNYIDNRLVVAKDRDAFTFPELSPDVTCYGNGVNFK